MASIILALLLWRADVHHTPVNTLLRVARCENHDLNPFVHLANPTLPQGIGQWMPGHAAWRRTPAYTKVGIDIAKSYESGDPNAPYFDVDMLAWVFSDEAPPDLRYEWSCY